ncbi:MAG UNVERIFIED_CONTAM: hypothetical protein MIO30_31035 [Methylobacterium ajmalii]
MSGLTPRRAVLRGIAIAPIIGAGGLALAAVPQERPDAELMRLHGRFLDAVAAEQEAYRVFDASRSDADARLVDAAWDATGKVVEEIEHQRATTPAGLAVKALACSWCYGKPGSRYPGELRAQYCTDVRLAIGIVEDLLAMGGAA